MNEHNFAGKWITDGAFAALEPRNVFHRQLEKIEFPADKNANSHILFPKSFHLEKVPEYAKIYITADDCCKLYLNVVFAVQGSAPACHNCRNYNEIDVIEYIHAGEFSNKKIRYIDTESGVSKHHRGLVRYCLNI